MSKFLLGHPDCQNFGRKFKPAFSGCSQHACGLASMHDLGMIAVKRIEDGKEKRGFETYVGGGLGAVPYQAKLFDAFVPPEEILPFAQAIARRWQAAFAGFRALPALVQDEYAPAKTGRLRRRDYRASPGRYHREPASLLGRCRAPLH